jgi:PAS domain S-box-containing protein
MRDKKKTKAKSAIKTQERTAELVTITEKLMQEIGERKKIEEALKEVNLRFLTLINAIPDIVFFKDAHGRHLIVNKATEEFHGLSQKDIIGKTCESFLPLDLAEQCKKSDNEVFEMRKPFRSEEQATGKDGNIIFLDTFKVPLYDESDNPIGLVGISRDITAHKKAEEALKQREQELETKTHNLEEANIALKVLLKKREEDKTELEEKILLNIKELVIPYLEKLKKNRLDEKQEAYISILESNLKDITSSFSHRLSSKFLNFTPTEIQIANLLRQGKTSKETAELLNSSPKSVAFHRENIRKKLGLTNKKINLKSYLLSLP